MTACVARVDEAGGKIWAALVNRAACSLSAEAAAARAGAAMTALVEISAQRPTMATPGPEVMHVHPPTTMQSSLESEASFATSQSAATADEPSFAAPVAKLPFNDSTSLNDDTSGHASSGKARIAEECVSNANEGATQVDAAALASTAAAPASTIMSMSMIDILEPLHDPINARAAKATSDHSETASTKLARRPAAVADGNAQTTSAEIQALPTSAPVIKAAKAGGAASHRRHERAAAMGGAGASRRGPSQRRRPASRARLAVLTSRAVATPLHARRPVELKSADEGDEAISSPSKAAALAAAGTVGQVVASDKACDVSFMSVAASKIATRLPSAPEITLQAMGRGRRLVSVVTSSPKASADETAPPIRRAEQMRTIGRRAADSALRPTAARQMPLPPTSSSLGASIASFGLGGPAAAAATIRAAAEVRAAAAPLPSPMPAMAVSPLTGHSRSRSRSRRSGLRQSSAHAPPCDSSTAKSAVAPMLQLGWGGARMPPPPPPPQPVFLTDRLARGEPVPPALKPPPLPEVNATAEAAIVTSALAPALTSDDDAAAPLQNLDSSNNGGEVSIDRQEVLTTAAISFAAAEEAYESDVPMGQADNPLSSNISCNSGSASKAMPHWLPEPTVTAVAERSLPRRPRGEGGGRSDMLADSDTIGSGEVPNEAATAAAIHKLASRGMAATTVRLAAAQAADMSAPESAGAPQNLREDADSVVAVARASQAAPFREASRAACVRRASSASCTSRTMQAAPPPLLSAVRGTHASDADDGFVAADVYLSRYNRSQGTSHDEIPMSQLCREDDSSIEAKCLTKGNETQGDDDEAWFQAQTAPVAAFAAAAVSAQAAGPSLHAPTPYDFDENSDLAILDWETRPHG